MRLDLPAFLSSLTHRRWRWGETDCLLVLADWVAHRRQGVDLAAPWRGTYSTREECEAILDAEGGIHALMSKALAGAGIARTDHAEAGDIGLVRAPVGEVPQHSRRVRYGLVGAMACGERRWALITPDRGLIVAPMPEIAAWSLPSDA